MRRLALLSALFLCAFTQDITPEKIREMMSCNLKSIQMSYFCEADHWFPEKDEVEKRKRQAPLHKGTDHELTKRPACIQVFFRCPSHADQNGRRPGVCKTCEQKFKQVIDRRMVFFKCTGCGGRGDSQKLVKHRVNTAHSKKLLKTCEGAGRWPHSLKK